jgi:hypothetical protein
MPNWNTPSQRQSLGGPLALHEPKKKSQKTSQHRSDWRALFGRRYSSEPLFQWLK